LLVLPLLVGRLSSIFASSVPGLPTTFGEAYQFTLASLLAQVPDSIRAFLPFLPDPGEPGTPYAAYLRSGIQRIFQVSALGLLFDKLWAARGLRKEADERLHRSLREAVALGDRVCGHLLRTLRKEVDTSKLRMAVLALGVIGDARHATKLGILRASGYCSEIAAETGVALALLGDLAPLPPQAAVVLAPSQHGGDTPLDLCRLVDALRSDQPTAEAAEDLRRLLVWQGVSTSLRHAVMFSLLRIPGALSARDAMEWTKEFVGSSRMSERGQEVLHMLGQASLSVSMEELATELASHWIRNPLVSLIPLARYTSASLDHDAHAYGRSGYPVALFVALTRAFEKEKARRHHRWRAVDKVLHAFSRWKCMINCFVFATVLEAFTKRRDQLLKERTRVFDGQVAASRNGSAYNGEPGQALT